MVLNQSGTTGAKGATGAKGDTGATGLKGATGAKGEAGEAGPKGTTGAKGLDGASAGIAPTVAVANCVGSKCTYKVGDVGPGGGFIFFVDSSDQFTNVNYLEAAPVGWGNAIPVNQGEVFGETTGTTLIDPLLTWCSNIDTLLGLDGWARSAVGLGATNTETADASCAGGAIQAASDYAGGGRSDWSLPSLGEATLMYSNLRPIGIGSFSSGLYWTSSEFDPVRAWGQSFSSGNLPNTLKQTAAYVRPVRAF